jgi:flagellar biogenesis protein FliO
MPVFAVVVIASMLVFSASAREFKSYDLKDGKLKVLFSEPLKEADVEVQHLDHYIQMNIKNTKVSTQEPFLDIEHSLLKKVAIFQSTPDTAALRLFVVDGQKVQDVDAKHSMTEGGLLINVPAVPQAETSASAFGASRVDLGKSIQTVGAFSLVLILFGLISVFLKSYLQKKRFLDQSNLRIQSIASKVLGPRQKIELIEIEGQRILIGIAPENITMLGKFERKFDVKQLSGGSQGASVQVQERPTTPRNAQALESVKSMMRRRMSELPNK